MAVLELKGITKRFGSVTAVDDVDFTIAPGEIHALLGENGAGKTTLMSVAYGLHRPDSGEVIFKGEAIPLGDPSAALDAGIGMVHQHFKLVPSLTVAENIFLGRETKKGPVIDRARAIHEARTLSERHGLEVPVAAQVKDLTVGERQRVEILRMLSHESELIILDEPTAVLAPQEVGDLFTVIRGMRELGKSIVIVTHKLDEVKAVADRFTVMRQGRIVGARETRDATQADMAEMMVGRSVPVASRPARSERGESVLSVSGVSLGVPGEPPRLHPMSFEVHSGEIVGVAGVVGNGQAELAEVVVGLRRATTGEIRLTDTDVTATTVSRRRKLGMAYIPEDRFDRGSCPTMSISDNLTLANLDDRALTWRFVVSKRRKAAWTRQLLERFDVRGASDPNVALSSLSGGNIQKVILARELVRQPRVLVASQPCRGVDVGATAAIHQMLLEERAKGMGILLISTELSEILSLSDRVLVLYRGEIVANLTTDATTREEIGLYMIGAKRDGEAALAGTAA
jgi:general nucleoside transport system ATP-binding protein